MQERQQRVPFTRPVFIAPIEGAGRSHRLLTGNISEGGMFVRSEARFDPGTPISVSLEARGQVFPFAQGEVVWEADNGELSTAGGLPGFGVKFTSFLNEGSPALLSHLVYRGPGANVSDELANQLGGDAASSHVQEVAPPADFMRMSLEELERAEPEVEWPEGISVPAHFETSEQDAALPESEVSGPSFPLDLGAERADAAPAPTPAASVSLDQARRVTLAAAIGIGVLIVAAVLLLRARNSTPEPTPDAPEQFEALDVSAAPEPKVVALPTPAAPPRAAVPVETKPGPASEPVAAPAPTPAPAPAPTPRKALPAPPRKVTPPPAPAESLSLDSGAVRGVHARRDGSSLDVALTLAPGARIERAFALSSPSRLVFDVVGAAPRASLRRDGDLPGVKTVRAGARNGGTRLVLDLDRATTKVVSTHAGARVTLK